MNKWFLALSCSLFATTAYANITLDTMSEECKIACGIQRLSSKEKEALQTWLSEQNTSKTLPVHKNKIVHGIFAITEVRDLGRFVLLENNLLLDVYSRSRKKTLTWKAGDKIELVEPIKAKSFKMKNISKNQSVSAKHRLK